MNTIRYFKQKHMVFICLLCITLLFGGIASLKKTQVSDQIMENQKGSVTEVTISSPWDQLVTLTAGPVQRGELEIGIRSESGKLDTFSGGTRLSYLDAIYFWMASVLLFCVLCRIISLFIPKHKLKRQLMALFMQQSDGKKRYFLAK